MTGSILFIDQDWITVSELLPAFAAEGYRLNYAPPGLESIRQAVTEAPDAVILGLSSQEQDWVFCQQFRTLVDKPLLLLLSTTSKMDRVRGLELGADDCMVKPVLVAEVLARIRALLRRSEAAPSRPEPNCFFDKGLMIDLAQAEVLLEGEPIELTPVEFRLLACFAQHAGQLLSHDQLARQVWGGEYPGYRDALKQYVHQLRQKLEKTPSHPTRILTRRGHGYLFRPIGGTRSSQP